MDTISSTLTDYIKQQNHNHSDNDKGKEVFINHFNDIFTIDQAVQTLHANMGILRTSLDVGLNDTVKQANDSEVSIGQLNRVYKSAYGEYRNHWCLSEHSEVRKIMAMFAKAFFNLTSVQYKKIESVVNHSKEQSSKLDTLNYDAFKLGSVDYYENIKGFNMKLLLGRNLISSIEIKSKENNDSISMANIVKQTFKEMGLLYENYTSTLLGKLKHITKANHSIANDTKRHLEHVEGYHHLLNSIYYRREIPKEHLNGIKKLLSVHMKDNSELFNNVLLNSSRILSKASAYRLITSSFGKLFPIIKTSLLMNKHLPIRQRAFNAIGDTALCLQTKHNLCTDLKSNDIKMLIKHLNDFERSSIAKRHSSQVFQLYLYAMTYQFSNEIYDNFVNSLINPK